MGRLWLYKLTARALRIERPGGPYRPVGDEVLFLLPFALIGDYIVMVQDNELLRAYWREGSEPAFSELVRRYVGLVFSTARRQVRDAALAEDVAQTVFCLLARKARSLSGTPTLAGWLYRATCFCATRAARREGRRRKWEQEAMATNPPGVQTDEMWERLAPVLDEALATLGDKDRLTILLRFFQRKPIREVGAALGVSEAAAKMRVARSVERLRQFFARRGVTCSASGLALLLAERSIEAAPAPGPQFVPGGPLRHLRCFGPVLHADPEAAGQIELEHSHSGWRRRRSLRHNWMARILRPRPTSIQWSLSRAECAVRRNHPGRWIPVPTELPCRQA